MKTIESVNIPTYADKKSRWTVKVDLSGRRYALDVYYNVRQNAWMLSITDANGELLIAGVRLVPGIYLLEKYRASCPELPPGELVLVDLEGKLGNADGVTRENLGSRFALAYEVITETE
uniref:Cyanophage baseplate Pam3 plug gp18 domain-containing protein n=1 Tax=uncultured bacterium contig00055 TaxID=1181539 RepID=A0A806K146_9BACT|nr:hypothetical protein [uncultured bacterium contig00055]